MRLIAKKCRTCGALGLGPNAIDLWPLEGWLYCRGCFREALQWDEQRGEVISGIRSIKEFHEAVLRLQKKRGVVLKGSWQRWKPYIHELSALAGWALEVDDRRTFVYYFSRAMYAWTLMEER